jgi:Tripartite tricarboxylate transporter family receptor
MLSLEMAHGKTHPGTLACASFGSGTVSHIYGEVHRQNTERRALMPDVPTLLEVGLPGFEIRGWNGLFGPAGMG